MRRVFAVVGIFALWACGPLDQSGSPGSGSGGADGGVAADGGTVAGGPDAGGGTGGGGGGGAPLADCTGVMPGPLGPPATAAVQHGGGDVCWNATTDLSGNVAAESHPASMGDAWVGHWRIWSADGHDRGDFDQVGGDVFGQREGFETTQKNALVLWSATGSEVKRTGLDDGCSSQAFPSATSTGSLVLVRCGAAVKARRFDDAGNLVASADVGTGGAAAGVIDLQGRTLVVIAQGNGPYTARWFDASLAPASATFPLSASGASLPVLRPLASSGAAVQVNGVWVAVVRSGVAAADDVPPWLASHANFDLQLIRNGTAYALIPRAGATPHNALDLVAGNGDRCGSVTFPVAGLSMGPEGTVIGSDGDAGCTHSWWSALLR